MSSRACTLMPGPQWTCPGRPFLTHPSWGLRRAEGKVKGGSSPDDAELGGDQDDSRPGRRLMQERDPHNWPFSRRLGCAVPHTFPCSNGARSPGNQDRSTTHSSGLDDSDSTSHSLLLCVSECVCTRACAPPGHEAVSCACVRVQAQG